MCLDPPVNEGKNKQKIRDQFQELGKSLDDFTLSAE